MRLRAFYASKLSENISVMPEGYLICKNVPIARTGVYEYLGEELGLEDYRGQKVSVIREEEDVFEPAALASFEMKPVTDEHPTEDVGPANYGAYMKGTTSNVRRGTGADSDKVLADLIIYDPTLIGEIQAGKREVSCGYCCDYDIDEEGRFYQRKIRGNHVAVVMAGRAGSQVAIKDSAPEESTPNNQSERSNRNMPKPKTTKKTQRDRAPAAGVPKKGRLLSTLFPIIAKDADPEDVREALETLEEVVEDTEAAADTEAEDNEAEDSDTADTDHEDNDIPPWAELLLKKVGDLQAQVDSLSEDSDPLDELEDELSGDSDEEGVSEKAENMDEGAEDSDTEDSESSDSEAEDSEGAEDIDPQDEEPTDNAAVNDSLLRLVKTMKPVIANMKDAKAKKRATDALVKTVRQIQGKPAKKGVNGYGRALDAKKHHAKQRQQDRAGSGSTYDFAAQQAIYDKHNPHINKNK